MDWIIFVGWIVWLHFSRFLKLILHFIRVPAHIIYLPIWIMYQYMMAFIRIYALFTMLETHWGNREVNVVHNEVKRTGKFALFLGDNSDEERGDDEQDKGVEDAISVWDRDDAASLVSVATLVSVWDRDEQEHADYEEPRRARTALPLPIGNEERPNFIGKLGSSGTFPGLDSHYQYSCQWTEGFVAPDCDAPTPCSNTYQAFLYKNERPNASVLKPGSTLFEI
jgi:hypothetical protein